MATGGTDSNWAIIQGTTGVVTVRCPDSGFLHYIVRTSNLKDRLPRKLNLPISGQASFPITFDEEWRSGQMMWFFSKKPTDDLILAIEQSQAQCAGKVDLTVAPLN